MLTSTQLNRKLFAFSYFHLLNAQSVPGCHANLGPDFASVFSQCDYKIDILKGSISLTSEGYINTT